MTAIGSVVDTARSAGKIIGMFTGRPDLLAVAPTLDLVAVDTDVTALRRGIVRPVLLTRAALTAPAAGMGGRTRFRSRAAYPAAHGAASADDPHLRSVG